MSVSTGGIIYFNREFNSVEEKIEFSFDVQKIANKNKIGVNQGGNIKEHTKKSIHFVKGELCKEYLIEIADDPLDFNSEYIFGGYDFQLTEINKFDSFECRIERVEFFLEELLNISFVESVEIFININKGGKIQYIESRINEFERTLREAFIKEGGWTPSVHVKILR